jgi:hypothetical protein
MECTACTARALPKAAVPIGLKLLRGQRSVEPNAVQIWVRVTAIVKPSSMGRANHKKLLHLSSSTQKNKHSNEPSTHPLDLGLFARHGRRHGLRVPDDDWRN